MMDEDNRMDRLAWARRVWQTIPYNARYATHAAITAVQQNPSSTLRELSPYPDRYEYLECATCGGNTCSGSPGWYRCRLCGAPAFRRVWLRDGRNYSWPWPLDDLHAAPRRD